MYNNFTTELDKRSIEIRSFDKVDKEFEDEYGMSSTINWELQFEERSWGVKGMYIGIIKITLNFHYHAIIPDDGPREDWKGEDREYDVEIDKGEWNITTESSVNSHDQISPNFIEIDFQDKTIEIQF
tara:strand:+ start:30 stop:410 length:381 start_codon:yes stop_codon:yes gene_type:complete